MSIYLEFPSISEYPLYTDPFKNDGQLFYPEEDQFYEAVEDRNTLQDYLTLKTV
ncbi:hypothetical protein [Pedobacter sp. ASV28]|uniref:hypothetical protein n=1 Tax=Pedobacter sp. ASV28 TaxID=2795123 RepID=UPI0018EB1E48|nr:hypothetical protein [Pedobacter sp. ASV28]